MAWLNEYEVWPAVLVARTLFERPASNPTTVAVVSTDRHPASRLVIDTVSAYTALVSWTIPRNMPVTRGSGSRGACARRPTDRRHRRASRGAVAGQWARRATRRSLCES